MRDSGRKWRAAFDEWLGDWAAIWSVVRDIGRDSCTLAMCPYNQRHRRRSSMSYRRLAQVGCLEGVCQMQVSVFQRIGTPVDRVRELVHAEPE